MADTLSIDADRELDVNALLRDIQRDGPEYTSADFWARNRESRAALISAVTSLRLFLSQLGQSVDATYAQRSGDERATAVEREETDD